MTPGYVYVLQNTLFGPHILKIGFTTSEPDTRALQLYSGSSGVPIPFDVVTAYFVGDCKLAEKRIHKRLKAFRVNGRREFFRMTPSIAASLVYESCAKLNEELGLPPPKPYLLKNKPAQSKISEKGTNENETYPTEDTSEPTLIDPRKLKFGPIGSSQLTSDQEDRIKIVAMLLSNIFPSKPDEWTKLDEWLQDFTRDRNPESEIRIWEQIAKAYLTINEIELADEEFKLEAFTLLIQRSASSTAKVLSEINLKYFSRKSAKRLLQAYELKPKPFVVEMR